MMNSNLFRTRLLATSMIAGVALVSSPVFAQTASDVPAPTEAQDADTIVVTGSLISNPNLQRSSPVNVTNASEIELRHGNNAEAILREIPGITPNIGQTTNNGNNGSSYVDLRGLGANRNIVLLDGRRIVPAGLRGQVDLNNIPLALVDRVDVLTGAASTTYGADAVTGVVNFITKRDFSGAELQASEGISEQGDGNTFRLDGTIGANFDDGRGNAVFSVGYQKSKPIFFADRAFGTNSIESLQAEAGGGSPTDVFSSFTVPGAGEQQIDPTTGALVDRFSTFNFNPFNVYQTPFKRFNMFGAAHYQVTDAVEVYTRGLFSKNTVNTVIAPSGVFNSAVTINLNNPFLPAAARATFCANNDFDPNTPDIQTLTPAQCAAGAAATGPSDPNYRTFTTNLRRRTTEVGNRISEYETTIFDYRLGFRGNITNSIKWDVSGGYGESKNTQSLNGYVSITRARQSLLANSTTACTVTTGGCVPADFFGPPGSISPAAANYLQVQSTSGVKASLAQANAQVSGDFGVASPYGVDPISFAVGGEYRKYKASQFADTLSQQPGELGGSGSGTPVFAGGYDVYEAFGELVAPLVQDRAFFQSLTLEAGVRYSHYTVDAFQSPKTNTTTYKFGGSWEPVHDLKLRGSFSHAVRSPNINELFAPANTTLTNLGNDPCAGAAPTTNANLRAICLAQGAPAFTIGNIANPAAGQPNITTAGNINLKPEKANTITFGAVVQPSFVPGLSFSVDYYSIKVTDAITQPLPGDLITACFGANPSAPSAGAAASEACTVIRRDPGTGGLDGDAATTPGLFAALSNLGKLKTSGIDATINYNKDIGFAKLGLSFTGNYTRKNQFQATPSSINRECVGYYSVNCSYSGSLVPKFQWSQRTTLSFGKTDLSLLWRHIDKMNFEPATLNDQIAAATVNPDCPDPQGADTGGCVFDPQFRHIKAADYFDLAARFGVGDHMTLTLTVDNLLDRKPPIVGSTIGSTAFNSGNTYPSTYDAVGRRYGASVRIKY
jgi:iron complex outermembrane receptor protein